MKLRKMKRLFFQRNVEIVNYKGSLILTIPYFVTKKVSFKRFLEVLKVV